jgi:hypothetical protein
MFNVLLSRNFILPLGLLIAGIALFNLRITGFDFHFIPGDSGDARFINYLLEHGHQYFFGNHDSFWSAPFMFPLENTIAYSDHMLLCIPFYSLFRIFGSDMETSMQLWWILSSALNFCAAYYVANKLFQNPIVAGLIAFVFAFGTINLWQINYVQMNVRYFVPFAIYYAYLTVNSPSIHNLIFYLFFIVLQFYSVMYTAFFLFYFTFGFMVLFMVLSKNTKTLFRYYFKSHIKKTIAASLIALAFVVLLLLPYLKSSGEVGLRLFGEVKWNLPVIQSYLFAHPSSIWGFFSDFFKPNTDAWWLQSTFGGLLTTIVLLSTPLILILHYLKQNRLSLLQLSLAWTIFILFLLFLRTDSGFTLYALIFKLPGMNSMRVLNRFSLVFIFFLLALLGTFLIRVKPKFLIFILLVGIGDQFFNPNLTLRSEKSVLISRRVEVEKMLYREMKQTRFRAFVLVSDSESHFNVHLDAMMASFTVGKPCVNGYSSSCPDEFGAFFNAPNETNALNWLEKKQLDRKDIRMIRLSK